MPPGRTLRWLLTLTAFCAHGDGFGAAEVLEPVGMLAGNGVERGVARLVCRGDAPRVWHHSRVFVIDTRAAAPRHDLLFGAAHGLPTDAERIARDCAVYGVNGPPVAIIDVSRPEAPRSLSDDWAILMTATPLEGDVGRLRMAVLEPDVLEALVSGMAPIKLLLYSDRSGLGDCNLLGAPWISSDDRGYGLFAHSCRSRPGLSGAPIVVRVAGEPVAIGMNLGHRVRPPRLDGPLFYGIGRAFDVEIVAAIRRAAERVAAMPHPTGR